MFIYVFKPREKNIIMIVIIIYVIRFTLLGERFFFSITARMVFMKMVETFSGDEKTI